MLVIHNVLSFGRLQWIHTQELFPVVDRGLSLMAKHLYENIRALWGILTSRELIVSERIETTTVDEGITVNNYHNRYSGSVREAM